MYQVLAVYQAVAQCLESRTHAALLSFYNERVKQQIRVIKTGKENRTHERKKQDVGGEWLGGHGGDSHV